MLSQIKLDKLEETQDFGRFIIEPLEPGYGQTIGNSLRRVLLGDLSGSAVTHIKISGAMHQFTTIPGVVEDVAQLILNIKKLKVRLLDKNEAKLSLTVKGPGDCTAKDIKVPSGVEIMNPDLYLAHLSDAKGKLALELTVAKGTGYVKAEEQKKNEIGTMAIDSLFSPVLRVDYKVEDSRVGRRIDFNKLTLEITTNGTISPSEALQNAAEILMEYFNFIKNPQKAVSETQLAVSSNSSTALQMSIEELDLPARITNALLAAKIETVADFAGKSRKELLRVKNLGAKSLAEIEAMLKDKGVEIAS